MTQIAPVVAVPVKQWWQSKTIWLNILGAVLIALEAKFSMLQPFLPGNVYAWFSVFLTAANAAVRVVTAAQIVFRKPAE